MVGSYDKVTLSTHWVCLQSEAVSIDENAIETFVTSLTEHQLASLQAASGFDRDLHFYDAKDPDLTAQYILVVDALNFCFWPLPGFEYEHLAGGIKTTVLKDPQLIGAQHLASITSPSHLREIVGVDFDLPNAEERIRLLRELGEGLLTHYEGKAANMIRAAEQSSSKLVSLLTSCCPGFQDHTLYKGRQVFFYKRAQIFVGDLYGAFRGDGLGKFNDISNLTMFADYRVPVVLRELGILKYSDTLASKIDSRQELQAGSDREVEIRAASIQAVEKIKAVIFQQTSLLPLGVAIDWMLWEEGERNIDNHKPHHRTKSIYY